MKKPVHDWLQRQWYCIGFWHLFLVPISLVFFLLALLRRVLFRLNIFKSYQLPVPVIVVGNISVGGTGKTPLVISLVKTLKQAGYRPGIISRGYGASQNDVSEVFPQSHAEDVGDEPLLMVRKLSVPVFTGADRVAVGMALLAAYPDCNLLISDDGLQHYRLKRDVEIAVLDAKRGLGNGLLLPAGPLRELPARLNKVDFIVSSGGRISGAFAMTIDGDLLHSLLHQQQKRPEYFANRKLHAVAGIGNPDKFFDHLRGFGLKFEQHVFPDHHAYNQADFSFAEDDIVLMTEKDAVKCESFAKDSWWYLPVEANLDKAFTQAVIRKVGI